MNTETFEPIILVDSLTFGHLQADRRNRVLRRLAWAGLAGAGIAALLAWPRSEGPEGRVRRGDIIHSWVALGRVESESVVEIVPRIVGRIQAVHVGEGDPVEAGQLLVTLEAASAQAELEEVERGRDVADAHWQEIQRGARPEDLDQAAGRLSETEQESRAAEARVRVAAAEGEYARKQWGRLAPLGERGLVTQQEVDDARRRRDSASAMLAEATATHVAAEARRDQARALLERIRRGAMPEERQRARAELGRAEARVARLREGLRQTKLFAPVRGIVVRRYKEPSELAFPEMPQPILVLAGSDDRHVRAEVLETELFKVRRGQEATITSDAYPGQSWRGSVVEISPALGKKRFLSENPKERTDVKVLEVKIRAEGPLDLPLNLPVEARVVDVLRRNVLVVPGRALDSSGGVQLPGGERRRVQLGARDDAFVEVVSGLSEGESLVPR